VLVSGQPVLTLADQFPVVVGTCPFTLPPPPSTYHPCVIVKWTKPALRVFVRGSPVILQDSTGICQAADQAPQGPPRIPRTQVRVNGI
jgi:hypothetical protein